MEMVYDTFPYNDDALYLLTMHSSDDFKLRARGTCINFRPIIMIYLRQSEVCNTLFSSFIITVHRPPNPYPIVLAKVMNSRYVHVVINCFFLVFF